MPGHGFCLPGRPSSALWRAGRWLADPGNRLTAAKVLSAPQHLGVASEVIDPSLSRRIILGPDGAKGFADRFLTFHDGGANFPWRSRAAWIGAGLAGRLGLDPDAAQSKARAVFRSDLYRLQLAGTGAALPRASDKAEGVLMQAKLVPGRHGRLTLMRNRFFDGAVFDPVALPR